MNITRAALATACVFCLLSCTRAEREEMFDPEKHDFIDKKLDLSRKDYINLAPAPKNEVAAAEEVKSSAPPIPEVSQILIAPRPPEGGGEQLVSLSVTEDVPLKDVLIELSRLANVDLELDPGISGGIIFRATNKPLSFVVERIADLAGLRYTLDKGVLRVEKDVPYIVSYNVDFLNIERSSSSSVNISTNVLSAGEGGGDSLNTGSTSSVTSKYESDLWAAMEDGLKKILETQEVVAPVKSAAALAPAVEAAAPDAAAGATAAKAPAAPRVVDSSDKNAAMADAGFYSVNKQAGVVTVSATKRKHSKIKEFVNKLNRSASAQVLIEAKIVEVTLDEAFRSGIDWQTLNNKNFGIKTQFGTVPSTEGLVTLTLNPGADLGLDAVVNLTESFGTARTLSSPRLHAMNNQQAVLTFAENKVYFEIKVDREQNSGTALNQQLLTVDSTIKTVPIGIILTMQPAINLDSGEITLNVRPTLSRITGFVSDPAVAFLASESDTNLPITNEIPVVEVRELDSILKLRSGQVMVIGGLMEQRTINDETGVPYLSAIPFVGNAFKGITKTSNLVEMVIFIKATLVGGASYDEYDANFYKKFTADPRPLAF